MCALTHRYSIALAAINVNNKREKQHSEHNTRHENQCATQHTNKLATNHTHKRTSGATQRLDAAMIARGLAKTPDEALRFIMAREVKVNDCFATSPATRVRASDTITLKTHSSYVSRGGYKLEKALTVFHENVAGKRCIDIGSSTGGFSDCLLQAGAAQVSCVDVNYGQLAWKIRTDARVRVFERTNIRTVSPDELDAPYDVMVADLSFIGLASLAGVFAQLGHPESVFIGLVKPQFESKHNETCGGVVLDSDVRTRTIHEVEQALEQAGFTVSGCVESPIKGARKGNIEYLVRAVLQ